MNATANDVSAGTPTANPDLQINIVDEQVLTRVDHSHLRSLAETVLIGEGVASAEVNLAIVDDPAIHDVNRRFLQHDYPTDVISFLLSESGEPMEGDLIISAETAVRSAKDVGCSTCDEISLYLVHGLLHLCGYDDHDEADRREMRRKEQSHLQKFGILPHYGD